MKIDCANEDGWVGGATGAQIPSSFARSLDASHLLKAPGWLRSNAEDAYMQKYGGRQVIDRTAVSGQRGTK